MLNFCAVLLELCKPFFADHPSGEKLGLISRDYPTSSLCRLDFYDEPCFAKGIINSKNCAIMHTQKYRSLQVSWDSVKLTLVVKITKAFHMSEFQLCISSSTNLQTSVTSMIAVIIIITYRTIVTDV